MNRSTISIEAGRIDRVSVIELAEDRDRCLLTIVGNDARIVIETGVDDLWRLATACRDAVNRRNEQRRVDDLASEAEPPALDISFADTLAQIRKTTRGATL